MQANRIAKKRGFTIVELIGVVSVLAILVSIVVLRIADIRKEAVLAKDLSNLILLQGAYERAKLQHPEILTDNSVPLFVVESRRKGLINREPEPEDLAKIQLAPDTSITNNNARFQLSTDLDYVTGLPPIAVRISRPAEGALAPVGIPMTVVAAATAPGDAIVRVVVFSQDQLLGTFTEAPFQCTATPGSIGNQTFRVIAYTALGRVAEATSTISVIYDSSPVVALSGPSGTFLQGTPLVYNASASDPDPFDQITTVELLINNEVASTVQTAPYGFTWTPSTVGDYAIKARAFDTYGTLGDSGVLNVTIVDNLPPTIAWVQPASGASFAASTPVTLAVSAADPDGSVTRVAYYLDGALLTEVTSPFHYTWAASGMGDRALSARAYDNRGVMTPSGTRIIQITQNRLPQITWLSAPTSVQESNATYISFSAADPDSGDRIVQMNLLKDGIIIASTNNGSSLSLNWGAVLGQHLIEAQAIDLHTNIAKGSYQITVNPRSR